MGEYWGAAPPGMPPPGYGAPPPYGAPAYAPPGYGAPPPYGYGYPAGVDEVRTVFISGFPEDFKSRELQNLVRFMPGYEACQINTRDNGPINGFVLYQNGAMALGARDALQGLLFDADTNVTLRAEMAKRNMHASSKRPGMQEDPNAKRQRTGYGGPPMGGYPPPAPYTGPPPAAVQPVGYAPVQNMKDNAPCNTLFVGNLSDGVSEEELRGLFSYKPGFKQLKVNRNPQNTVCFVEFVDVPTAGAVHGALQGAVIQSSDRGGIRIQFSKNPFGRKRDGGDYYAAATSYAAPPAAGAYEPATYAGGDAVV